jgi:hypothetical protein
MGVGSDVTFGFFVHAPSIVQNCILLKRVEEYGRANDGRAGRRADALRRMELERPDKPCSLARLSKQAQRPMSVLRRQLTMLEEAGWSRWRWRMAASAAPSSSRRRGANWRTNCALKNFPCILADRGIK